MRQVTVLSDCIGKAFYQTKVISMEIQSKLIEKIRLQIE
jgi:hypothetical protein